VKYIFHEDIFSDLFCLVYFCLVLSKTTAATSRGYPSSNHVCSTARLAARPHALRPCARQPRGCHFNSTERQTHRDLKGCCSCFADTESGPGADERLGPSHFFIPLVLGPLNSLVWYVPSLRYTRGLGWRMHCGAEVTESSTNKQHLSSSTRSLEDPPVTSRALVCPLAGVRMSEGS
jgi:hypothetical protein